MTAILEADASVLPPHLASTRRRPAQVVPALRPVAIAAYQTRRWLRWHTTGIRFALTRSPADLAVAVHSHASPLLRKLGESEMWLQHNKVVNLRLAVARLDGVLIRPGETFSFCRLVGRTTRRRGYVEGMMLEEGRTVPGVGGGICQIANVLHWLALHSTLTVTERSTHSEDPFPDEGRTVPWGTGCTIFYNYADLQLRNDTASAYQVRLSVGETHLTGTLRAAQPLGKRFRVYSRNERFLHVGGAYYRANEIWRDVIGPDGQLDSELIQHNMARTLYDPS